MANEHDTNGYHGHRYLIDAKNERQYAIRYDNGKPQKPLHVFNGSLKNNETAFAFDDEIERSALPGGRIGVSTAAFQITASYEANGEPRYNLKKTGVTYEASLVSMDDGRMAVRYELTPESIREVSARGFDTAFPLDFEMSLSPKEIRNVRALGGVMSLEMLRMLPFPPHQALGSAFDARRSLANPVTDTVPEPEKTVTTTTPSRDFNRNKPASKPVKYKISDAAIEAVISQFCKDLTGLAEQGKLDPVIGRKDETDQALKVITRRKQSSLCFTGEAGVGKSAMFAAIAQRITDDADLPESLKGARVLELDLQAMNAGAKFRGQFEEKLKPLIDGLQEREGVLKGQKIIMAIDEIHSQLTAGKAEGGTDSGNMMKPFLTAKGISVMGTTTDEEYKKHIEKDGALGRRFERLRLESPNEEDTVAILKKLWPLIKEHNKLTEDLSDEDFKYVVSVSNREAPQEAQPSKSEKVLMMAAASAEFHHRKEIDKSDIISAVAKMSNLSADFLNRSEYDRYLELEKALPNEVLGQPGLQRIVDGLIGARGGLADPNQPWGCFVLQGPTGTGKTETVKAIARHIFGSEDKIIQLNMGEYQEKHTVSRLIGAPPGYVGFDDAEPALTEKVRQNPNCILLLDEIDKAHPDVFNVLLPVLNDGKMKDNHGKTVLFKNVIVIMTTNAGAKEAKDLLDNQAASGMGFGVSKKQMTPEELQKKLANIYSRAVSTPQETDEGGRRPALFRPEMVNRIETLGGFITYLPLAPEVIHKLVARELKKLNQRLSDQSGANIQGVELVVSDSVKEQLGKDGYNPAFGARPLAKVVREKLGNPLSKWLMQNRAEIVSFVAQHGAAKIMVDTLAKVEPKLMEVTAETTVANDNTSAPAPAKSSIKKKFPKNPGM